MALKSPSRTRRPFVSPAASTHLGVALLFVSKLEKAGTTTAEFAAALRS